LIEVFVLTIFFYYFFWHHLHRCCCRLVLCFFFFFLFYYFLYLFIYFCSFFVTCLNKNCSDIWVVDVNSFLAFGLRRMGFGIIGFFALKVEEYELLIMY
jgi:hypothetical protein